MCAKRCYRYQRGGQFKDEHETFQISILAPDPMHFVACGFERLAGDGPSTGFWPYWQLGGKSSAHRRH